MTATTDIQSRQKSAILGMFIGDALAMPVHWYYDIHALKQDYGRVSSYLAPKHPHPDSILWRSVYTPPKRSADILHDQRQYWGLPGIHYHQFLKAGENTLNLKLCNLLISNLSENGGYDADAYLDRITYQKPHLQPSLQFYLGWITSWCNSVCMMMNVPRALHGELL